MDDAGTAGQVNLKNLGVVADVRKLFVGGMKPKATFHGEAVGTPSTNMLAIDTFVVSIKA